MMPNKYHRPLNTSLFVRNVDGCIRTNDLRDVFSEVGPLVDVYIPLDYFTHVPRGFAYVQYEDPRDAEDAAYELDGVRVRGCNLGVEFARGDRKTSDTMRRGRGAFDYGRNPPRRSPPRYQRRHRSPSPRPPRLPPRSFRPSPRPSRHSPRPSRSSPRILSRKSSPPRHRHSHRHHRSHKKRQHESPGSVSSSSSPCPSKRQHGSDKENKDNQVLKEGGDKKPHKTTSDDS